MCVRRLFYLACTRCNNQFYSQGDYQYGESAREIRDTAKGEGWIYTKVENGSFWDVCPRCQDMMPTQLTAPGI